MDPVSSLSLYRRSSIRLTTTSSTPYIDSAKAGLTKHLTRKKLAGTAPAIPHLECNETGENAMSTTRFESTLHALKEGAKSFTIEKATSNIEGWEEYLSKHDHEGVKRVVQDLGKLKKLLQAGDLDGNAIKDLIHKLGKETTAVAGHEETASAKHIRDLGAALSQAA